MFGYFTRNELIRIGFGSVGKDVMISRSAEFANVSNIFIGDNSRIDTFTIIAPSGNARFKIGDNVQICAYTILNGLESITLGDYTTISPHCSIFSSADDFSGDFLTNATIDKNYLGTFSAPVVIEKHSIIGAGTTILPGVTISTGTAVGAHSLIKESTKPFTIIAGVPAKFVRNRSDHILEIEKRYLSERSVNDASSAQ
jgi:dTDP-4-amino-4,6-dideoxy-D-glucose acyltransferase